MLNPWEWLKYLYELAGHKHPVISAIGITVCFAVCGLAVWWRLDSQYRKDHPPAQASQNREAASAEKSTLGNSINPPGGYQKQITLHNPDGMDFLVYPSTADGRYLCKILNGSPSIIRYYQINVTSSRSFDTERLIWSDPVPFRAQMGPSAGTNPRDYTREFTFAQPQGGVLRIGEHVDSILNWPTGDPNPIHRWRINMMVSWQSGTAKGEWPIDLCFRRDPSTNVLEFMEYKESIPLASF